MFITTTLLIQHGVDNWPGCDDVDRFSHLVDFLHYWARTCEQGGRDAVAAK